MADYWTEVTDPQLIALSSSQAVVGAGGDGDGNGDDNPRKNQNPPHAGHDGEDDDEEDEDEYDSDNSDRSLPPATDEEPVARPGYRALKNLSNREMCQLFPEHLPTDGDCRRLKSQVNIISKRAKLGEEHYSAGTTWKGKPIRRKMRAIRRLNRRFPWLQAAQGDWFAAYLLQHGERLARRRWRRGTRQEPSYNKRLKKK